MELFGLKDKDGKEYKLILPTPTSTNTQVFVEPITPEPKFKVGDWVCYYTNPVFPKIVFRINNIHETHDKGRSRAQSSDNEYNWYELSDCRLATKEEIETHLKSIADEKYFNKTALCLEHGDHRRVLNKHTTYYKDVDELVTLGSVDGHTCNVWLYRKGKWAEIIPEKKKLPKTKEEFNLFLGHWNSRHTKTTKEFLDQYED